MGLQKYRADKMGQTQSDGSVPYYAVWMGGDTLALVRNCDTPFGKRTVYVRGDADTFFSIPAACRYKGKTVKGYIYCNSFGEYKFRADQVGEYKFRADQVRVAMLRPCELVCGTGKMKEP